MFFVIVGRDKPGSSSLRAETKARHMKHLDAGTPAVRALQSGPLLSQDGTECGSLVVVEADGKASVEEFLLRDPYVEVGLFTSLEIHQWLWRRGNPYLGSPESDKK